MEYLRDAVKSYDTMLEWERVSKRLKDDEYSRLSHYRQKAFAAAVIAVAIELRNMNPRYDREYESE